MRTRILLAALFAAVLIGLPAALSAAHLARAAQPEPDPEAVAAAIYPGTPVGVDRDRFSPDDDPAWLRFMNGQTRDAALYVTPRDQPAGTEQALIAATRDRLAADGWRIGPGLTDSYAFTASRGHATVDFYAWDSDPDGLSTWAEIGKVPAWWVTAVAVLAGLAGTTLGGWLILTGVRRLRDRSPRARTAIRETVVVGLVLVVPAVIQAIGVEPPGMASVLIAYGRWPALLGVLLILGAAATLVRPRRAVTA